MPNATFSCPDLDSFLIGVFADEWHVEVEATWGIYQRVVTAYRLPDRRAAKTALAAIIDTISAGVPAALTELATIGRTRKRRAADVLALLRPAPHQQRPHRGQQRPARTPAWYPLGFRNLTNYIARSLLDTGVFRPRIRPLLR